MDSIEITISGTPYDFANVAIHFGEKQRAANPDAPRYYTSNVPRISIAPNQSGFYRSIANTEIDYAALQNSGRLIIECVQDGGMKDGKHQAVTHLGQITALKIPNEKSQLRVVPNAENATAFLQEWELLRQEMIRLGFAKRSGQDWIDDARREVEKMQAKEPENERSPKAPVLTLQRKPTKQVKLLPRRLKDGLNCNANAADVVGVLFGGVGIRKMEITGAQCAGEFELHCATSLSINTSLDSDYVVFISLTLREIESMETGREELLYLLWDSEVAEIKIKQEQAGHCRMELYIDENEHQWMHSPFQMRKDIPMEQDQNGYDNKFHGLPLIDECWHTLKTEWVRHETATRGTTAPAQAKSIVLNLDEWQANRKYKSEMTWGEMTELVDKRARGDAQARQKLDDYARAEGYSDFDTYFYEHLKQPLAEILLAIDLAAGASAGSHGKLSDDPVVKMIMLRHEQPEIANDPYLGLLLEKANHFPVVEIVKQVRTRMTTKPIAIAPAPKEQNADTPTTPSIEPNQWQKGTPPRTQAEKRRLVEMWDAIPREERPLLADWLIEQCGTDHATENPNVNDQTFHGWRRYKNS